MKKVKQIHKKQDSLTSEQALQFLEDFRSLVHGQDKLSRPISIRIPENVLESFKRVCKQSGVKYQSQIVQLMRQWLIQKKKP